MHMGAGEILKTRVAGQAPRMRITALEGMISAFLKTNVLLPACNLP